jgi:hypothetical protein
VIQASIRNNAQTSSLWLSIPLVPAVIAVADRLAPPPVGRDAVEQLPVSRRRGCRLVEDDYIQSANLRLVLSKRLPDDPFYSIPAGRMPAVLLGYRQAEPGGITTVLPGQYRKPFVPAARGFFEHAAECFGIQ